MKRGRGRPRTRGADPVEIFARAALTSKATVGPWVRRACERHLRDLDEQEKRGLVWRWDLAEDVVEFFRTCLRHGEGEHVGKPFVMLPWEIFCTGQLYGWRWANTMGKRFRTAYIEAAKGCGKALAIDTQIPTPAGWSTMGDLEPGQTIFDDLGQPCTVSAVSPIMHDRPCYRVTFDDGESVVADGEHLWATEMRRSDGTDPGAAMRGVPLAMRGRWKNGVHTTEYILRTLRYTNGKYQSANHSIALAAPLDLPDAELPIPPYVLGVWLGDGDADCARITCAAEDAELLGYIEAEGIPVRAQKVAAGQAGRFGLTDGQRLNPRSFKDRDARAARMGAKLRGLGLFHNKHIPIAYLRGSFVQRLALLQGLADTDGYIDLRSNRVEICSVSPRLAADIKELVTSLGIKVTCRVNRATLNGRDVGLRYRVGFHPPHDLPVFRLRRKLLRQVKHHARRRLSGERRIVTVEQVQPVPVRCIKVTSPSRLFLCGQGMIPTHNSPFVAGLAVYEMARGHVEGAEIFTAATGRDQAKIVFKRAELMVNKSPALQKRITITRENMACPMTGSFFRPVSREAGSLEGHNVHLAIIDEVHVHKNADVCDTMQDGTKGRPDAQVIEITNTGAGTHNVCYDHRKYSENILDGLMENDGWFSFICGLDKEDDWRDPKVWPKANPSLGVTISQAYLSEQVQKAEGMPARMRRVKRLNFCIWDDAGPERAIDVDVWKANGAAVDREALLERACYGGLDLAAVNDLTALVLLFPDEDNRMIDVLPFFWLPEDGLAEKERRDRVPYRQWVDQGLLELTPGSAIDDWYVAKRLEEISQQFDIQKIAYDRWGMEKFKGTIRSAGVDLPDELFVPFGQGYASMAPAINEMERRLVEHRFRHGMNPPLTMNSAYAVCDQDPAGNRKWNKAKANSRIDGIVALCMAVGVMCDAHERPPQYQVMVFGPAYA